MAKHPTKSTNIRDLTAAPNSAAPSIRHPLAGQKMTGAEMIVQVLADEGVSTIFGYSRRRHPADLRRGVPLQRGRARRRANRRCRSSCRRTSRARASWPRATRAPAAASACAIVTSGPGATNTVTPVRDCMADSIPIVVICGQVPTAAIGTDAFQEAPVPSIMGSVAKHIFLVTDPDEARSHGAHRVRNRAHRPAGPGGHRHSEGRAELVGRVPGHRARCPCPATASASRR